MTTPVAFGVSPREDCLCCEQRSKSSPNPLIGSGLASAHDIQQIQASLPAGHHPSDGLAFSEWLIAQNRLTSFQAAELLEGTGVPLVLGDYVLLSKIGAGGMGQVFLAHHARLDRHAAIKILPTSLTKNPDMVRRFEREVKAAAKLSHPNIVHAYDASVQGGVWYLVMEHVPGIDLATLVVRDGPLSIARAVDYMSPEQAFNTHQADARSDIYLLGCTLHRLLTGTPMYGGESVVQKLLVQQQQPIPMLADACRHVSQPLEHVFARMVAKKPEDRFQSVAEVEDALASVCNDAPTRRGGTA